MGQAKKHKHSDDYYNDIALRLFQRLYGVEHLHYGYFKKGLKPQIENIAKAQEEYVKVLLSHVPASAKVVFDVGCGTGGVASKLIKKKKQITCLAPDPFLIEKVVENTDGKVATITDLYENVDHLPPESFDLVLMSESCQYIKIEEGWQQNDRYLKPGGHVLIADFFRIKEADEHYTSKSGHNLEKFKERALAGGFTLKKEVDITPYVAPTMDIYQDVLDNRVFPILEAVNEVISRKFPRIHKMLSKFFAKKVGVLRDRYSKGGSKLFSEYKRYVILLFQKSA